jgi:hypothetical protein
MVAHFCNPSYSEDADWEDLGPRPALSKNSKLYPKK